MVSPLKHATGLHVLAQLAHPHPQPGGDQDFHLGIAAASQNQRLFSVLSQDLYEVMRLYRFRSSLRPGRAIEALNEHRAIVACLAARDPANAEDAMRAPIRSSWQNTKNTFLRTGEAG